MADNVYIFFRGKIVSAPSRVGGGRRERNSIPRASLSGRAITLYVLKELSGEDAHSEMSLRQRSGPSFAPKSVAPVAGGKIESSAKQEMRKKVVI